MEPELLKSNDRPRKIAPEQVEIVGAEAQGHARAGDPASNHTKVLNRAGLNINGFGFKNIKVISSGPLLILMPILLPILFILMIVVLIPFMIFGKRIR